MTRMSLVHFEGCERDVSLDYAVHICETIAMIDDDERALCYCDMYHICKERGLTTAANKIIKQLKEYLKNA